MPNAVREFAYQPAVAPVQKKQGHPVLEGAAILSCILVFLGAVAGLTWWDGRYAPSQTTTYIVQPHDTQWSIAQHFNPNTDPKKARKLQLTLTFKADESRDISNVDIDTKSTLAPVVGISTKILMGRENDGTVTGAELIQTSLFRKGEDDEPRQNVTYMQRRNSEV